MYRVPRPFRPRGTGERKPWLNNSASGFRQRNGTGHEAVFDSPGIGRLVCRTPPRSVLKEVSPVSSQICSHWLLSRELATEPLAAIAEKTGIRDHDALYSTKEQKKVRVPYFTPDEETWERQHAE